MTVHDGSTLANLTREQQAILVQELDLAKRELAIAMKEMQLIQGAPHQLDPSTVCRGCVLGLQELPYSEPDPQSA